jgi:hypothetical protein
MCSRPFVVAALLVVTCTACAEQQEASYADLAAAERAGAIQRGWVPDWLPKSARGLREIHNLDTNQSMLAFRYDPSDQLAVPNNCSQVRPSEVAPVPFVVAWWPRDVPPTKFATHRRAFFSCGTGRAFLALSAGEGEAYYWSR